MGQVYVLVSRVTDPRILGNRPRGCIMEGGGLGDLVEAVGAYPGLSHLCS